MQNERNVGGMEGWSLQNHALSRRGCDRALPREGRNLVVPRSPGLDAAARHPSTWSRQQTNATVLVAKDSHGALS